MKSNFPFLKNQLKREWDKETKKENEKWEGETF